MSLVAYYSSDEGENSDADDAPEKVAETQMAGHKAKDSVVIHQKATSEDDAVENVDPIPIEDDEYDVLPNQSSGLTLPPPKHSSVATSSTFRNQDEPSSILSGI